MHHDNGNVYLINFGIASQADTKKRTLNHEFKRGKKKCSYRLFSIKSLILRTTKKLFIYFILFDSAQFSDAGICKIPPPNF